MYRFKSIKALEEEAHRVRKKHGIKKSISFFEEYVAVKHSPYLWRTYMNFAKKFCSQDEILNIYQRAYKEFSDSALIIRDYANYLYDIKDYDNAIGLYEKGIELFPSQNTQFYLRVGDIYKNRKKYKLAKKQYEKVLDRSPNHSQAWKRIANIEGKIALINVGTGNNSRNTVERFIEFPPKYYQSGLSILSYFNTILNQKYPDIEVKITIKQENTSVKMIIESPDGTKEVIEQALYEYGLVVVGQMSPAELLSDQYQILALENKLDVAKMELNFAQKLLDSERTQYDARINSLENEISKLYELVNIGLSQNNNLHNIVEKYISTNDESLSNSLKLIETLSLQGASKKDKNEVFQALETINAKKPGVLHKISELIINGAISGASGNMLYSWILAFCNSLPK